MSSKQLVNSADTRVVYQSMAWRPNRKNACDTVLALARRIVWNRRHYLPHRRPPFRASPGAGAITKGMASLQKSGCPRAYRVADHLTNTWQIDRVLMRFRA